MKTHKVRNTLLLLLTALIWGCAFVAQSVSMDYIGPLTFTCLRFVIGGLVLLPVIKFLEQLEKKEASGAGGSGAMSHEKNKRKLIEGGIVCGTFLFFASCTQQIGIQYTTVGKAGFITTFYIIVVPLLGLFFKRFCGILTWIAVVIALVGLYFLCMTEKLTIQMGDAYVLLCAFLFAAQIMAVDHYAPMVDNVKMSCIQFFTAGILGAAGTLLFESPDLKMILGAAVPILYTGVMSSGVAYTLQVVAQKGLNPTVAALIMSLESVFSALAGYVILHQVLTARELLGCVLMFIAIVLAQLPDFTRRV